MYEFYVVNIYSAKSRDNLQLKIFTHHNWRSYESGTHYGICVMVENLTGKINVAQQVTNKWF